MTTIAVPGDNFRLAVCPFESGYEDEALAEIRSLIGDGMIVKGLGAGTDWTRVARHYHVTEDGIEVVETFSLEKGDYHWWARAHYLPKDKLDAAMEAK